MNMISINAAGRHHLPDIDCVLIGVNCSKTLARCLDSIRSCDYPQEKLHSCYVDGGSTDKSIEIAERYEDVTVIALDPAYPTPGMGRNAGWKHNKSPFVQFLDSDTILDARWLRKAVEAMADERFGAVIGMRQEMYPERTVYNWIGNIEWNGPAGLSDCFGGDVFIRRTALEKTGGYDETLVGGEDPELSRRVIRAGWQIVRLDALMTRHDLAMTTMSQYFRRAFRSGYGFAAVSFRESLVGSSFWKYDVLKIFIKAGSFFGCIVLALLLFFVTQANSVKIIAAFLPFVGLMVMLSPRLFKTGKFMRENNLNKNDAKRYAWHCSVVVVPQFFGIIRFHLGRIFNKPLKNRRRNLKTGISISGT
ncbi:glycosyltransferase [Chlorobium phaeobacteroides]|uniref:Glycosyl transferase, family 2 n=1 Tax=Chlorobium phaeobacteroides (strain DSM 266 / SMG 266 / 2430) TaxID=290317 RepID=A1BHF2_CHLPD|nr:glycosyltransferase [Chlorobium phaeobacteroides]ABL65829.1 glycosyl transferase, family 2 [Chlorobium phaeobacteroides DSM 266]